MKLKFTFGFLPVLVTYVDSLGGGKAGESRGPWVRVVESYANDTGLLEHELTHARQWYMAALLALAAALVARENDWVYWQYVAYSAPGLHGLLYLLVPAYKLWAEVEAYKVQMGFYPDDRAPLFAGFIADRYDLDTTQAQALQRLR